MGVHPAMVYQTARRSAAQGREWDRLLAKLSNMTEIAGFRITDLYE